MGSIGHTFKADIWSIGILICEMIGGFVPFKLGLEASNPKTIMEKIRNGNLNLPRNLNTVARDLVKKLLDDDPPQRLEICEIKAHRFFNGINWKKLQSKQVRPPFIPQQPVLSAKRSLQNPRHADHRTAHVEERRHPGNTLALSEDSEGADDEEALSLLKEEKELMLGKRQSATGGTGGRKIPGNFLGNFQMKLVNKAFEDF